MKKVFSLILSFMLIFIITGCAKNDAETQGQVTPPPKTADIEDSAKEKNRIEKVVTLYFPDDAVMYLIPTQMHVNTIESKFYQTVVEAIIKGPATDDLNPSISGDVKVLSATVDKGLCTVDLSSEFAEFNTGGSTKEQMAIFSIVNTLCGLDDINKVKINIEGDENPVFGGHITLDEPFEADTELIKPDKQKN